MKSICSEGVAISYFTNSPLIERATHIFQSKIRAETPPQIKSKQNNTQKRIPSMHVSCIFFFPLTMAFNMPEPDTNDFMHFKLDFS